MREGEGVCETERGGSAHDGSGGGGGSGGDDHHHVRPFFLLCVSPLTAPTPPRPFPLLTAPFDGGWGAKAQMSGTATCANAGGWAERSAGASDDDVMWLGAQKQAMALLMCLVRQHSVSFSISLDCKCGGGGCGREMITVYVVCVWYVCVWGGVYVWCVRANPLRSQVGRLPIPSALTHNTHTTHEQARNVSTCQADHYKGLFRSALSLSQQHSGRRFMQLFAEQWLAAKDLAKAAPVVGEAGGEEEEEEEEVLVAAATAAVEVVGW